MADFNEYYLNEAKKIIDGLDRTQIDSAVSMLLDAHKRQKQIFIFGNGGSASTSSHFANDLIKFCSVKGQKRFRAVSLADNISTITALANDMGYDKVFSEQLYNLANDGDLIVAFSVSGNSPNVVEAVKAAKRLGAKTIAFLGFKGGNLKNIADECVIVENEDFGLVESVHLLLEHLIVNRLRKSLAGRI
ncbi:SIS domain-containing protein [Candidatus Woesearchaeota archaeon]|nr:SIS domain-containing protein [Candidatus Woesearchaeota archaeon]